MRPVKRAASYRGNSSINLRRTPYYLSQLSRFFSCNIGVLVTAAAVLIFTCIYFIAIRQQNVELSFDQLSAFERRVQTVGNHSIYVVEAGAKDDVLATLPRDDWGKVASRIDFVAFVYGEVSGMVGGVRWMEEVARVFKEGVGKAYGIVLFECGCVVPNLVFRETKTRFQGAECMMFPGFVMGKEVVRFVKGGIEDGKCLKRDTVLGGEWYNEHAWKLQDARMEHQELRKRIGRGG